MSQVSLNLVALTVFALVMAALFGPLVHLSPELSAIAVAGLLGVAALDTFGWQGRGSALMLDGLAGFSAAHRDRIVHHEAGHFLVAQKLGIPVTGYTLNAWEAFRQGQPGLGGVQFATEELDQEMQQGKLSAQLLDRYCAIWMAGAAAETLVYGDIQGGTDDRQKIQTVLNGLWLPLAEMQQKQRWAALQAKTLLQDNWQVYEALVVAMAQRLPVEQCRQICQTALIPSPSP